MYAYIEVATTATAWKAVINIKTRITNVLILFRG